VPPLPNQKVSLIRMSIRLALVAIHFELYQTLLALIATVAVLHILLDYNWPHAAAYGAVTVAAYWVGQGIVALIQRAIRSRTRSSMD
jgi:hypothetical protein